MMTTMQIPSTTTFASPQQRWQAVLARNPAADGQFVFCVSTTGVYCRPSCPARRPLRQNVQFHDSPAAAERAGFRACLRCRPNEAGLRDRQREAIAAVCRAMEQVDATPSLDDLARQAGMSRFHFQRVFKALIGLSPARYIAERRAARLRETLPASASVTAAVYNAGFNSPTPLYAGGAAPALGMKPSTFRARGQGETIRFAAGDSSLGKVMIAATDKGICALILGDDTDALENDLRRMFRSATLIASDRTLAKSLKRVIALVESPGKAWDLPLDIRGTVFQRRVWDALTKIPPGTTTTYSKLAARLAAPRSVRAVARACATNNISLAIPCHRVVRTDGDLAGYRWGVERKRRLLEKEAKLRRQQPS